MSTEDLVPDPGSIIQTMNISAVKNGLSSLVNEVYRGRQRVLVKKAGIPVAALVSVADLERLEQLDREWDQRTAALEVFDAALADVPIPELKSRISQILAVDRRYAERRRVLQAMREPFQDVPDEEIAREVAKAVAEVRAEMRAEREALLSPR